MKNIPVQKRFLYIFIFVVVALGTFIYLCHLYQRLYLYNRVPHQSKPNFFNASDEKIVLFWTSLHSGLDWGVGAVRRLRCHDVQCVFTNDSGFLDNVNFFDAVVFHPLDYSLSGHSSIPPTRDPSQSYVFALLEAPTRPLRPRRKIVYNITMTYRLDSDVLWAYAYIRDLETDAIVAPAPRPSWKRIAYDDFVPSIELEAQLVGKTKSAAWFVSNCKSNSKRDLLVKELQKYMQVDIFGKCGSLSCTHGSSDCHRKLDTEYKFYLAFENSLCLDYTTEKLFNALKRTVLPIVYGGSNYNRFAPPHSYVDVQDFENVSTLANYLQYLEKNTTAYATYFWWKDHYRVSTYENGFDTVFCRLCHFLHSQTKVQYYPNIMHYWLNGCQEKPRIKF